ncbi:hypothetical protein [Arthrobacter sp. CJ23]|uniref:hypothetical protein n=1 Tax=Arthrobacter sp. CJ23 TaxID=2972479 RepID=UPI00215D0F64|nr:hypothetical protein [Arthrobacter sp. CJ23]UVJ39765.1 hypothetical protein NVV90_00775 [Arthrobacter sp. CJ23]
MASDKLSVVVRVDLDGAQIQIAATGHVTTSNLHALYPIVQRTYNLADRLDVEMDLTQALVEPDALEQLQRHGRLHELPVRVDRSIAVLPPQEARTVTLSAATLAA